MDNPTDILGRAIDEHKPVAVHILFSGGGDSALTTHKTLAFCEERGIRAQVVSVNTLLHGDGWPEFIGDYVKRAGWPFAMYTNPDPGFYERWCVRFGFPYTPRGHLTMQNRLKLRAIEQLVRDSKTRRMDRVMLVTGFRKYESKRRMATSNPIQREGAKVWVNPIYWYSDEQKHLELADLALPHNPYKDKWGISGDCGCGAFAEPGEYERVKRYFPGLGRKLEEVSCKVKARWGEDFWGWDEKPCERVQRALSGQAAIKRQVKGGQLALDDALLMPMCGACRRVKPGYGDALDSVLMDRMAW